ncbi:hypothetical protein BME53_00370 [Klebsiella quasipneumoniae subsp. similipneumoniae]|nr:hypothetical protein [Klebsiella quasipneumoniae]OVW13259.1 hypothetical protein BME61_00345 [Klebsiella quasipneumoniae subsp. similipneumoniae]OVW23019.1 hypothetical protein BME58_05045 [Klebsiella quasipneumoniae subsp. similipneumoniae]OVW28242.1 hypothetical protein BME56_05685 [Klebsiella quasipneumoniae subsp. similipneumoniae]OVW36472.1 hypothetical protein BME53_00370 [Klebsiella quasipneumoniae subsp. similipneumoniae]
MIPTPAPSRPVQAQPRRTKTVESLLCRAATAPCPAYDPCDLSLINSPFLLKLAVGSLDTAVTLPPGRGHLRAP